VIDASTAVWAVLPVVASVDVVGRFDSWRRQGVRLTAPALWPAESVSASRRLVYTQVVTTDEGRAAINGVFALQIELLPMDLRLCHQANMWAERLNQARAYDGFYLALAEMLGAEFWTADRRLANAGRQLGVAWIHRIG
jgi:predicted nucleic acid-binding protein